LPFLLNGTCIARIQPLFSAIDAEECTREFMPLVRRMAYRLKRRLPSVVEYDDLLQFGLMGLLQAAQRYKGARARFGNFALLRIRGAMLDGLRATDSAPRRLRRDIRHRRQCISKLEQALARPPTAREIAAEMRLTLGQYHCLVHEQEVHEPADLQSAEQWALLCNNGTSQCDALQPLLERCAQQRLTEAVAELPRRERDMLQMRLGECRELRHIAEHFGVTESRVCQLLGGAAARLRSRLAEAGR
jgi:RNA polymerase sigma factor for flagellar operon FliA